MATYLILTDNGIVTQPVQAADGAALAAILGAAAPNGRAAAIQLTTAADVTNGQVPQAFLDAQTNMAALIAKATAALNANATFLALASPTNAQTLAQVQTLTKECSALIRLALGLLDSTAGT